MAERTQTVFVSIGNSDNKLTQAEWYEFVAGVIAAMRGHCDTYLGDWYSAPFAPWQNMCCAAEVTPSNIDKLAGWLDRLRVRYKQDSIALLPGTTRLIGVG